MSQDDFERLVPGDAGLLLYGALLAKARKNTEQSESSTYTSSSGIGAGALAGIFVSINVAVIIAIIVIRRMLVKAKEK